jgi:very-short-patch-repair endonuclease
MQRSIQPDMFFGAKRDLFQKAELLRQNMTQAEEFLWNRLNKNQLRYRFKAQHPIDIFIVDFYCHKFGLVVEVDGEIHFSQQEYDAGRTADLEKYGLKVIRFTNNEITNDIEKVVSKIKDYLI